MNHLQFLVRFARTWRGALVISISTLCLVVALGVAQTNAQSPITVQLSSQTKAQIQALVQEKQSRTFVQQKISSSLLYTAKRAEGDRLLARVPQLNTAVRVTADNRVRVNITTRNSPSLSLLQQMVGIGAVIDHTVPKYNFVQVLVPLSEVERIAEMPDVVSVRPYIKPLLSGQTRPELQTLGESISSLETVSSLRLSNGADSQPRQTSATSKMAQATAPVTNVGRVTSEGDVAHGAVLARQIYNVNGSYSKPTPTGVHTQRIKIGVLSDSFNNLAGAAADISSGDLPPDGVTLAGSGDLRSGGSDEGRAMLQIIHDLVPNAQLYFATAFNSEADFANNILALRQAGCDIIVDDVFYFSEPVFQDGIVAQAVNSVTQDGALYFSSAGNSGNLDSNTSGVWEGDFTDGGGTNFGRLHAFSTTPLITSNTLNTSSSVITLQWADAYNNTFNDYDLYVLDASGNIVASSTNFQTGGVGQNPFEVVNPQAAGSRVVVLLSSGAPRFLQLNTNRGRLAIGTSGQTSGHSAAVDAYSVAAVRAQGRTTLFTGGAANPVESFSSDGLRRIFYTANDTPITPGNFSSGGGTVRQKPDIAAADGVLTTLPANSGLNPFFGTSAAAPHAAGVAALLKSFRPSLTPSQMRTILTQSALDIQISGVDRNSGFGIVMANRALQQAALSPIGAP
jgi:hypothetical protein